MTINEIDKEIIRLKKAKNEIKSGFNIPINEIDGYIIGDIYYFIPNKNIPAKYEKIKVSNCNHKSQFKWVVTFDNGNVLESNRDGNIPWYKKDNYITIKQLIDLNLKMIVKRKLNIKEQKKLVKDSEKLLIKLGKNG